MEAGRTSSEKSVATPDGRALACGHLGATQGEDDRQRPEPRARTDLVERDFSAEEPDELWLTDVTYIATDEGWLYLCRCSTCSPGACSAGR